MPLQNQNGVITPINPDAYNLTADLAAMAASAGVVIPVANATVMNALTAYVGMCCTRQDLPDAPIWVYDGANWWGSGGLNQVPVSFSGLNYTNRASGFYTAAVSRSGGMIRLQGAITNTTTTTIATNTQTKIGIIPTGYVPTAAARFRVMVQIGSGAVPATDGYIQVDASAGIYISLNNGVGSPTVSSLTIDLDGIQWPAQ